jgi:hypothetical protein
MTYEILCFDFDKEEILVFSPYSDMLGLPFPLYLSIKCKLFISTFLLLCLVQGLKLRRVIFAYLRSAGKIQMFLYSGKFRFCDTIIIQQQLFSGCLYIKPSYIQESSAFVTKHFTCFT